MKKSQVENILEFARKRGFFTAREAARHGIHSQNLTRLARAGKVERITRGHYQLAGHPVTEHYTLAVVGRAVPNGVICLLSALSIHDLGSELPAQVWLAIDRRARRPGIRYPPLRVVRFSQKAFTEGIETHRIEGQQVRVYGVAKTIADLFKYRNKIGLDVALEVLREAWRERRFTMDEMSHFARICHVRHIMAPYLESLVA